MEDHQQGLLPPPRNLEVRGGHEDEPLGGAGGGLRTGVPESDFLLRRTHEPASPLRGELAGILSAS
jgi:hypothetical protein